MAIFKYHIKNVKLAGAICSVLFLSAANVSGAPTANESAVDGDSCDYIYGVDDKGLNDSQLLRYKAGSTESLGKLLAGYDIEALDISPKGVLYGASGVDTDKPAYLYTINMDTGAILSENPTGCTELNGISFNPSDGSLWGWDQVEGLVQIIDGNCSTGVTLPNPGIEVEDLSWNNAGDTVYFAYNNHNSAAPDSSDAKATHHIGSASADGSVDWNVCDIQAGEIEALEVLNDGTLLVGSHQNDRQLTTVFDLQACQMIGGGEIAAYDIEGLAACLPEVASCPSASIAGTWAMGVDTDCDGRADIRSTANYRDNLTWNVSRFTNRGSWSQQGCDMGMIDVSVRPQAIWTGTMGEDGSLSGTIKFNGRNMCWTANRAG